MNTTKQRIAAHKEKLPRVKEKLVAMIALLVLSATMLTTVSFAWLTLSTNPEVTGVSTAVAANGNLEVALANGTLTVPGTTQLGDGSLGILEKNLTWGNLINLSDPSYGLSNMVLRPSLLNIGFLDTSPLRTAVYSEDGRFDGLATDFGFASWQGYTDGREGGIFKLIEDDNVYGLRAITSVKYETDLSGFNYQNSLWEDAVTKANRAAVEAYEKIVTNSTYMNSLAYLIGQCMTATLNDSDPTLERQHVENLQAIFRDFSAALEKEQEYMLTMANYQIFLRQKYNENTQSAQLTMERFLELAGAGVENNATNTIDTGLTGMVDDQTTSADESKQTIKVTIFGLKSNIFDKALIDEGYADLEGILGANTSSMTWKQLESIVTSLVTVQKCQLDGTPISAIGKSNAMGYLDGETHDATICDGVLWNYEQRTDAKMDVKNLTVSAKYIITVSINANITTSVNHQDANSIGFKKDQKHAAELLDAAKKREQAQEPPRVADETYGFVIDFWVRTNAAASLLKLEGNILTETYYEDAKGRDADGNEVQLYTVTEDTGESVGGVPIQETYDVYMTEVKVNVTRDGSGAVVSIVNDENGNMIMERWRMADGHSDYKYFKLKSSSDATDGVWYQAVVAEDGTVTYSVVENVKDPAWKLNEFERVIGFGGENRVWDDDATSGNLISTNPSTQGSGSCYVFYADTPEDQDRGLALLSALKVAFVNSEGDLLAQAYLDTEHFFSDSGKIIVPLVLDDKNVITDADGAPVLDSNGEEQRYITPLTQNEAMLISAIVYLDGDEVKNESVLASSDIQGQFNIQFGSSTQLQPVTNDKLEVEELSFSATVDKTEFTWGEDNCTVNITAKINGITPQKVEAFFVRTITATQGVPLNDVITFRDDGNGTWTGSYSFKSPGDYVLRSLRIDGVEYDLEKAARPTVSIAGFAIQSLTWDKSVDSFRFMTSASSVSTGVHLRFGASANQQISSVVGVFREVTGARTSAVNFTYNSTSQQWNGTATFGASGEYVLNMLIINGDYYEIPENMQKTAEVICGIKVTISTNSPETFLYGLGLDMDPATGVNGTGMEANEASLLMTMVITDSNGNPIEGLSNVQLDYGRKSYVSSAVSISFDMKWNSETRRYEGEAESRPGTYQFVQAVIINGTEKNYITGATKSPTFNIISPEPPGVYSPDSSTQWPNRADKNQFTDGAAGKTVVLLTETTAQTVIKAVVEKYNGSTWVPYKDIIVRGETEGAFEGGGGEAYDRWYIPLDETGAFRVVEVHCWNVYADGKMYTEDGDPYEIQMTDGVKELLKRETEVNILTGINITLNSGASISLGGTSLNDATAQFMAEQSFSSGISMTVTDKSGNKVNLVDNKIDLTYTYDLNPTNYGGYTPSDRDKFVSAVSTANKSSVTITLQYNSSTGYYEMIGEAAFTYAGTYTLTGFSFDLADYPNETGNYPTVSGNPKEDAQKYGHLQSVISVYSKKPTVTISSVSPSGSIATKLTYTGSTRNGYTFTASDNQTNSNTNYTATLYAQATADNDGVNKVGRFNTLPTLTVTVSGVPSDTTVSLTLPKGTANSEVVYSRSGSGTISNSLGAIETHWNKSLDLGCLGTAGYSCQKYIGHGSVEVTTMTLTKDGVIYIVDLGNNKLVINNPSSVNQAAP